MSRLIDEDAVIRAVDKHTIDGDGFAYLDDDISCILEEVPTIEERKTGRWEMLQIPINPPIYKCSECGSHALQVQTGCLMNRHYEVNLTNFCPSCGADMRGEQNG